MPEKLNWVTSYEKGKYDLAVLHVDQQCLLEDLGKSKVFRQIRKQITDIPIIVLNHGTPVYPERFILMAEEDGYKATEEASIQWANDKMKELLKGTEVMIVNSHEAQKQWGFGKVIIHGMDDKEWFDLKKEPRIVTCISPAGIGDKYYGRRMFSDTRAVLKEKYGIETVWINDDVRFSDWDSYKNFLGKSLVYFNPTLGSPMPRSRTEAMLSGCCVVTVDNQDANMFIKNGENGFLVKANPEEAAKKLSELIFNYKEALRIGQEGKKTAIEVFSSERFIKDWENLVKEVLANYKNKHGQKK